MTSAVQPQDALWMQQALDQAQLAMATGEVPVGAVLVNTATQALVAAAHNAPIQAQDPTAHAEVQVLRLAAARLTNYRLPGTTLYVTLEPCMMCIGALIHARVERLVFATREPKAGAVVSQDQLSERPWLNHRLAVTGGVMAAEAQALLQTFFAERRAQRRQLMQR